jgi:hypothetical protein
MVPVGLMWGSDVANLKADQPATQQWINTARGQKLHLGRKDLVLNGPIDNPLGSYRLSWIRTGRCVSRRTIHTGSPSVARR